MKTLVIGASLKPERYSNRAVKLLKEYNNEVVAFGLREGEINGVKITKNMDNFTDVHTVTMYVNPKRQSDLYDYIFSLNPKRLIFNPGTENQEFADLASQKGIEVVEHCTLVMLNTDLF